MGTKSKGIKINCLVFADDIALLTETWNEVKEQTLKLQEQTAKIGLTISLEKVKILTKIKSKPKHLEVGEQKIEIVKEIKYLGEWID